MWQVGLRFIKKINKQLKADVTAASLSNEKFYQSIINHWYKDYQTIQKVKMQGFMIDGITTPKEAKDVLFGHLLQQVGQNEINRYLSEIKAKKVFPDRKYYSRLKSDLNRILEAPRGEQSDLMKELESAISNVAKYAQ